MTTEVISFQEIGKEYPTITAFDIFEDCNNCARSNLPPTTNKEVNT